MQFNPLPSKPTMADLGRGVTQLHECFEDHKSKANAGITNLTNEVRKVQNALSIQAPLPPEVQEAVQEMKGLKLIRRLVMWGGGVVFTAVVGGYVGLYFQGRQSHEETVGAVQHAAQAIPARPDWQARWAEQEEVNKEILAELKRRHR